MLRPITLVIPAAGSGLRLDPQNPKQFLEYRGLKTLEWTLKAFEPVANRLSKIVIALPEAYVNELKLQHEFTSVDLIAGGETRQQSVLNGLAHLHQQKLLNGSLCLVHDAARPLLHPDDLKHLIDALDRHAQAAILGIPVKDTLKKSTPEGTIETTIARDQLWQAQTPQAAWGELMYEAHLEAASNKSQVTDDASILELKGYNVHLIESQHLNFKITTSQDWELFKRLI
jgi:2-C-methyl-D-erythritol 4-phosphate cytidylyltransferase